MWGIPLRMSARRMLGQCWTDAAGPLFLLVFITIATGLAFCRHDALVTQVFDLGYYTQVIWNTSQGRLFATSLKPPTFLIDHFSPLLAVLAPLFWIAPDARTLLMVQMLLLASAIVPAYLLMRRHHACLAPILVLS